MAGYDEGKQENFGRRSPRKLLITIGILLSCMLAAFVAREQIARWILFRIESPEGIARGEACAGLASPVTPEFVEAIRVQMADPDSVRPISMKTLSEFPQEPELKKEILKNYGEPETDALAWVEFAARNKMGGMQHFQADGALNPQTCAAIVFSIKDDEGTQIYDAPPAHAPEAEKT